MGRGQQGTRFLDEKHPYGADLDLFGRGSLFELLCTARTRTGEDTLAAWLLGPADAAEVRARQEAVAELRPQLDLREDLALLGADGPARQTPSQRIAALGNLIDLLESRRNQLFAPLAYLLLWGTQMAFAIEGWRARSGRAIASWLAAVGQFEALCALAAYGYEHPDDPFPEVVEGGACYDGEGLGHPLLPADR